MTIQDVLDRVGGSSGKDSARIAAVYRTLIQSEYFKIFGKNIVSKGCTSCYLDALFEIKNVLNLKTNPIMYELPSGRLIENESLPVTQTLSKLNLTAELAELHLALNPEAAKKFSNLPSDWVERVRIKREELGMEPDFEVPDGLIIRDTKPRIVQAPDIKELPKAKKAEEPKQEQPAKIVVKKATPRPKKASTKKPIVKQDAKK